MRQLTRFAVTHRRMVFVLWVVALLAAGAASGAAGSHFRNVFTLPGTDTQRAQDLLKERFPQQSGESAQIVFHTDRGTLTGQRGRIDRALAAARRAPDVASVTSPFAAGRAVSRDGRTGFATVSYSKTIDNLTKAEVQKLVDGTRAQRGGGLQVELGGQPIELTTQQQGSSTELIGLLAA